MQSVRTGGSEGSLRGSGPRRGGGFPNGTAAMLCVGLSLLFMLTSLVQLSASYAASGTSIPLDGSTESPADLSRRCSHGWDWGAYADDTGQVDVIVLMGDSPSGKPTVQEGKALLADQFSIVPSKEFRLALDGFAASMDLEALDSMMGFEDLPFTLYPDLTVNATLEGSVVQIGADQLHARLDPSGHAVTGLGMVVAVIDTGVDYTHPDLGAGFGPGYKVVGGYDFVNDDSDPKDDNGHGTHVAGIVAANGGMIGVAPDATILAYKVLGASGSGSMSDVILAIEAALDPDGDGDTGDHADVISMSLGGSGDVDDPVCAAVAEAVDAGVVVVVAAGNEGPALGTVSSPGLAPDAITVGAADDSWVLAEFSSRGTIPDLTIKPEVSAPGVSIVSTYLGGTYTTMSGTSMATPHVSGGAALLLQLHPTWTPEQVKSAMVTGVVDMAESVWAAGAGGLWLPDAADSTLFFNPCVVSYGSAGDSSETFYATNLGSSVSVSSSSADWYAMSADGVAGTVTWSNESAVTPSSVTIGSSGSQTFTLAVPDMPTSCPEGYYDGYCQVSSSGYSLRVPFGFVVLSSVTVHVLDMDGDEVFDPYGGVYIYTHPDAEVAMGVTGETGTAPPATFLVPSGTYNVHATGHYLIYTYSDPYVLSGSVTVGRCDSVDLYLTMSSAYQMTVDLETDGGNPIYVKDFRFYVRHVGAANVSFHFVGSDYSIIGGEIFSLPRSETVYVSPTDATVGISVAGFSYSPMMWDFMERNWQHWFEYPGSVSTAFQIESTADLRYLLAWEFDGVDSSSDTTLELEAGKYSVYDMKYDIPGAVGNVWGNWGTHLSIGGDSSFYVRRDTQTCITPLFSGINRRTIVQGVFSSPYYPGSLFEGFFEQEHYVPDYSELVHANTISPIYLPNRNFLTPIEGVTESGRVGSGPYYASVWTQNTNDTIVLFQPLLRDQSGAKVGGMYYPEMDLKRNGMLAGYYLFAEFVARPDAVRFIPISSSGFYEAVIEYLPTPQICSDVTITLGFSMPADDRDPPVMQSLEMPQRFVPGGAVPLSFTAEDSQSSVSATVMWRAGAGGDWTALSTTTGDQRTFTTSVPTSASDSVIDLIIVLEDASGNYLNYTTSNAAFEQVPVVFELASSENEIGLRNGDASTIITGKLTMESGEPLCDSCCVPIELFVDGVKVGMLLDEYMATGSNVHDGSIRLDWHFNPANLFAYVGETIRVDAVFDLGVYEPVTLSFELTSIEWTNLPPEISLVSPADGSLIHAGTMIDLEISDDGTLSAEAFLDGSSMGPLSDPWDVDTGLWSDGIHVLQVDATDDLGDESSAEFQFEVDSQAPVVEILSPEDGISVPVNWSIDVSVSDAHLGAVVYSVDGGPEQPLPSPYDISLVGWELGTHAVTVSASDAVGHESYDTVTFTIEPSSVVLSIVSPEDGSVIRSGVPIDIAVLGEGVISCCWSEDGTTHPLDGSWTIPTDDWSEGVHQLLVVAENDLGGYDEQLLTLTIDDTLPQIVLESPDEFSFVTPEDVILMSVMDDHFASVSYVLWGATRISSWSDMYVSLYDSPGDGYFTINVTARDLAGNLAYRELMFAMDSTPPQLSIQGVEHGMAIRPGQVLDVEASDYFLRSVEWQWNGSQLQELESPYLLDIGIVAPGWQQLLIRASDYSGKVAWLNLSLFVDCEAPSVSVDWEDTYEVGSPLELMAVVVDDYAVESVLLWYELEDGSSSSIEMVLGNGVYRATLLPDVLWDGISVHVVGYDTVGHSVESVSFTLSAVDSFDEGDGDAGDDDSSADGHSYLNYILMAGGLVAAVALVMLLSSRNRRRQPPVRHEASPPAAQSAPVVVPARPRVQPVRVHVQQVKRMVVQQAGPGAAEGPVVVKGLQLMSEMRSH